MKSFFGCSALLLLVAAATTSHAADIKVACVGNSLTYGYGLSSPYYESYPTQLDTLLGTGYEVSNFGVSSKTMIKAVGDAYWTQSAFASARAFLPGIVVIELGTNDSKDYIWPYYKQNFKADYASMIDTFRVLSSKPQVWVALQPWANNASWSMYDTTIANQVNPAILEVALQKAAPVIDLRTGMAGHPQWYQDDSVHPNATGAKEMAKIVAGLLKQSASIRASQPVASNPAGVVLSCSPAGDGYQWYRNDTLLAGATASTLNVAKIGSYKVSVKVSATSQSRLVSPAFEVASLVPTGLDGRTVPSARVFLDASGKLQADVPAGTDGVSLLLWDMGGKRVANASLVPGVYRYRLAGRGFQAAGSLVVTR